MAQIRTFARKSALTCGLLCDMTNDTLIIYIEILYNFVGENLEILELFPYNTIEIIISITKFRILQLRISLYPNYERNDCYEIQLLSGLHPAQQS